VTVLAVSILRREATLLVCQQRGHSFVVTHTFSTSSRGQSAPAALSALLGMAKPHLLRGAQIRIALSNAFLACADFVPLQLSSESQIEAVAPALAESRAAGETAEELAVDVMKVGATAGGSLVQLLAAPKSLIADLLKVVKEHAPKAEVTLVTAATFSVHAAAAAKPLELALSTAGETFLVGAGQVRSHPISRKPSAQSSGFAVINDDDEEHDIKGVTPRLKGRQLCAAGLLTVCPFRECNLVRRSVKRRSLFRRIPWVAAAAATLLISVARYFNIESDRLSSEVEALRDAEREAWSAVFPAKRYERDRLVSAMKQSIDEHANFKLANSSKSSLVLWRELGKRMPDPEAVGLTMESLHLGTDGGRLVARVTAGQGNALSNASKFEQSLNASDLFIARSEFENKGQEVLVRMRLDIDEMEKKEGTR